MAKRTIQIINSVVNYVVLVIIVALIAIASYALWDSEQLYAAASKSNYTAYKPTAANEGKSFKELQAINPEVFSWITVYGTHIDYPIAQGPDDMKYVNTNAEGKYSLSGSIFLDSENSRDFSDFNSIIYGHHMDKQAMFGEIGTFSDKKVFDSHQYGNLFFDGKDHGLEFFAFMHVDAYDSKIFWPNVNESGRQGYLDNLLANAMYTRDIGVTSGDHIVLLTTCSPSTTNGRDVLVARISNDVFENPFPSTSSTGDSLISIDSLGSFFKLIPLWTWLLLLILVLLLLLLLIFMLRRRKMNKQEQLSEKAQQNEQEQLSEKTQQDAQAQQDEQAQTLGRKL